MTALLDSFGRRIEYVRLSVTDRCDLRCSYCMPQGYKGFQEPESWLSFDEIERVIRVFSHLGVKRIRLTGGEPLVRRNISQLAERLSALPGIQDLSLSTNATQLEHHAESLRRAGVSRINVSLDTLQPDRFAQITHGRLDKVLAGLEAAKKAAFEPIKINMVVMAGVNDDEVEEMVRFCLEHDFTLRFIETMPVGDSGREAKRHYVDLQQVRQRLEKQFSLMPSTMPGGGPARYFQVANSSLRIGFITPLSQHFCETCNRVRLSADGTLYLCLGQEDKLELRPLLRQGMDDQELQQVIISAIQRKPERHEFNDQPGKIVRFMSSTGG